MDDVVQVLADRVLVKVDEAMEILKSGLALPPGAVEAPQTATVQSAGVDVRELDPGDRVIFSKFSAGTEVTIDGEELLVLRESDVILKFNG